MRPAHGKLNANAKPFTPSFSVEPGVSQGVNAPSFRSTVELLPPPSGPSASSASITPQLLADDNEEDYGDDEEADEDDEEADEDDEDDEDYEDEDLMAQINALNALQDEDDEYDDEEDDDDEDEDEDEPKSNVPKSTTLIAGEDDSDAEETEQAAAAFEQVNCAACDDLLQSAAEVAVLPCFHPICVPCAEAEEGESTCPFTIAVGEEEVFCGTRFSKSQILFPVATSQVTKEYCACSVCAEEGKKKRLIMFHCEFCLRRFCRTGATAHDVCADGKPASVVPISGQPIHCPEHLAMRATAYCNKCDDYVCPLCLEEDPVEARHQKRGRHVNIAGSMLIEVERWQSPTDLDKYNVRRQGELLDELISTLLLRRAVFIQELNLYMPNDDQQRNSLRDTLCAGIDADVKTVQLLRDQLTVKHDLLVNTEREVVKKGQSVRVLLQAFTSRIALAHGSNYWDNSIPVTTTPHLEWPMSVLLTGALPEEDDNYAGSGGGGGGGKLTRQRIYPPNQSLDSIDKSAEYIKYRVARDFTSVREPRKVIKLREVQAMPFLNSHFAFTTEGLLVFVTGLLNVFSFTVCDSDVNVLYSFDLETLLEDNCSVLEVVAGLDGSVWVRSWNIAHLVSVRDGTIQCSLDLKRILDLEHQVVVSFASVPTTGALVFFLKETGRRRRFKWPVAMVNTDAEREPSWLAKDMHMLLRNKMEVLKFMNQECGLGRIGRGVATNEFVQFLDEGLGGTCKFDLKSGEFLAYEHVGNSKTLEDILELNEGADGLGESSPQYKNSGAIAYDPSSDLVFFAGADIIALTASKESSSSQIVCSFSGLVPSTSIGTSEYNNRLTSTPASQLPSWRSLLGSSPITRLSVSPTDGTLLATDKGKNYLLIF